MHVEVDQSGRLEFTKHATVLAFSNGIDSAILVPAKVKRAILQELRSLGKGGTLYYLIFATLLYILLKDNIDKFQRVTIDIEYRKKDAIIREHLLNLLKRAGKKVSAEQIDFKHITKKSPAHRVAIRTFRSQREPNRIVRLRDILREF